MSTEVCLSHGIMRDRCVPTCKVILPDSPKADLIRGRHARYDSYRYVYPRLQLSILPGLSQLKAICLRCFARTTLPIPAHKELNATDTVNHFDQYLFSQVENFGHRHKDCK